MLIWFYINSLIWGSFHVRLARVRNPPFQKLMIMWYIVCIYENRKYLKFEINISNHSRVRACSNLYIFGPENVTILDLIGHCNWESSYYIFFFLLMKLKICTRDATLLTFLQIPDIPVNSCKFLTFLQIPAKIPANSCFFLWLQDFLYTLNQYI